MSNWNVVSADFDPQNQAEQTPDQANALKKWLENVDAQVNANPDISEDEIVATLAGDGAPEPQEIVEAYKQLKASGDLDKILGRGLEDQVTPDLPVMNDPSIDQVQSPTAMPAPPADLKVGSLLNKWAMGGFDNDPDARPPMATHDEVEEEYRNDRPNIDALKQDVPAEDQLISKGWTKKMLSEVDPEAVDWGMRNVPVWVDPDGPNLGYNGYHDDAHDALEYINNGGYAKLPIDDYEGGDPPKRIENHGDLQDSLFGHPRPSKSEDVDGDSDDKPNFFKKKEDSDGDDKKEESKDSDDKEEPKSEEKHEENDDDDSDDDDSKESAIKREYNRLPKVDGSSDSIKNRIAALEKFTFKATNAIRAGGIALSGVMAIDRINLDAQIEIGDLKHALKAAMAHENKDYLAGLPKFRVAEVGDNNPMIGFPGGGSDAWLEQAAESPVAPEFSLEEEAGLFAIDIPDHSVADAGAVQMMARNHIAKKTNGLDSEIRARVSKRFVERVEVLRRAEVALRSEMNKSASTEPKRTEHTDIEGLFL